MTKDLIIPSWEDVAERWKDAYFEAQAKLETVANICAPFQISNEVPDEGITDVMRLASRVLRALDA